MATTFLNLGFESQGLLVGEASGWTLDFLSSVEEFAAYGPTVGDQQPKGFEDYEAGWDNDLFIFLFSLVDLDDAFYDSVLERPEDFEEEWLTNEQFSFELSAIDVASYDAGTPQDFEDYEEEWLSNENFEFQLGAIAAAGFGGFGGAEDFEQDWGIDVRLFKHAELC